MTNLVKLAITAKGPLALLNRTGGIVRRYGWTPAKMDRALDRFVRILREFDCGATFPITAIALHRHSESVRKYRSHGIEFAVHGYRHVDHSQLSEIEQRVHLAQARQIFVQAGLQPEGFRSPYLRWNSDTLAAIKSHGFAYDSSQALAWDGVDDHRETDAYRRVKRFYGAVAAADYPALPRLENGVVRIPYCIPDDEALIDRLRLTEIEPMAEIWLRILRRTYQLGELFTLGLHPERIALCEGALRAVLAEARSLSPAVWIAQLGEIATWWRSRTETTYQLTQETENSYRLTVNGPAGTTILARCVAVQAATEAWADGFLRVMSDEFAFQAQKLPFIGLSPDSPAALISFLQQQGYLVERGANAQSCALYLNYTEFAPADERSLLAKLAGDDRPLLRFGRWPGGAQSALAVTGDIDALTLRDYGLRMFGG